MTDSFSYDVFLSHSSKDKTVVRAVAERLRTDGLHVWFDEWEIKPGDSIPAKIEDGLEHSRVLVLCMSANAFGSEWAKLEAYTFRFRDPLNKDRRFIPLRLDDAPIKGSLAQFLYINWCPPDREQEYVKLLEVCRGNVELATSTTKPSAFVTTSDLAARVANRLKYYVYVSHSKVEMLFGQLASIESDSAHNTGSTIYLKLADVVANLREQPGIASLPRQTQSLRTGYYEDTDKWNMGVLDNSDSRVRRTAGTAFCMYKDQGNILTLLLGSSSNMIGNYGDQSRHRISPSWTTDKYLLTLVQSWEENPEPKRELGTLEDSLGKILYFCGNVCAYMRRTPVNVLFRALYVYRIDATVWKEVFDYQPDSVFVNTAEHLVIGSPIYVALSENAPDHSSLEGTPYGV